MIGRPSPEPAPLTGSPERAGFVCSSSRTSASGVCYASSIFGHSQGVIGQQPAVCFSVTNLQRLVLKPSPPVTVGPGMKDDADTLCARLYRLAELVELARQLPPEDRARTERMIAQARQAVCEARRGKQRSLEQRLEQRAKFRTIVLQHLVKGTHPNAGMRIRNDDTFR
jgi:hypothetical protein